VPTTYPSGLPSVPADRWGAEKLADLGIEQPDEGRPVAVADSAQQAEQRLLAYIDNDYEDDLRGATATAADESSPGRWRVTLRVPGEF
jgi:hypothetical protein